MEQIIEIFADAISAFILKSISLQEENAIPGPELKKNADVVVETSRTLIQITREVANSDYKDFPDIQQPILDCAQQVERAVQMLIDTMAILYKENDRALGWRKLVESTKTIGEQTSRLLVVIYGAEEKRLRRAAEAAIAALRKVKRKALLPPDELRTRLKEMADDTGDASSKVVQFNTFVGGRYQAENDPDLKEKLHRAFDDINQENQVLVQDANDVITGPDKEQPRKKFVGTTDKLIDLINDVLGNVKRPEDLDAYKIIEDLFNSGNQAVLTQARPYDELRNKGPYSKKDLEEMGKKVIKAMEQVKKHPSVPIEDVINDANIGSARIAGFSEMVTVFGYQPENSPMRPKLLNFSDGLNRENANLVGDVNDYLKTQRKGGASVGGALDRELGDVKSAIRNAVAGAGNFARSPGTSDFVPSAKTLTEAMKDLLGGVNSMVSKADDPSATRELSNKAQDAKGAIVNLINAGKQANSNPSDGRAKDGLKSAVGQLKASIQGLLGEANALNEAKTLQAQGKDTGASRKNKESEEVEKTADRVIDLVKDVLGEINPDFGSVRDLIGKAARNPLSADQIDRNLLQRLADDALRALEQLKGYPRYTPKETLQALEYAVEAVDLFGDRLGTKADAMRLKKLKDLLQNHVKNISRGNDKMINSCEDYIGDPNPRNDKELLGDINYLQDEIRAAMKQLDPGDVGKSRNQGQYYNNVDPNDVKELGEKIKKSDEEIRRGIDDLLPKELAKEAEENIGRADKFHDMVESLASDSRNPGFKNQLNDLTRKLRPVIDDLAGNTNRYLEDPDSNRNQDRLKDTTRDLDKVVDEILDAIVPKMDKVEGRNPGDMSPAELQRMADQVKKAAKDLKDDYKDNAPTDTVREATDAAQKAADFEKAVQNRAGKSRNPEHKRDLEDAVRQLERARDDLTDRTNKQLQNPNDRNAGQALERATDDVRDAVDKIMDQIRPQANGPERQTYNGKVTPKDIEREGRIAQDKLKRDDKFEDKAPKEIVRDAEDTGKQLEKLGAMLEAMGDQQERPAMRRKIQDLSDKLRNKNDDLTADTNKYINDPDNTRNGRDLHDKNKEIQDFIDEVIKEVKPKVKKGEYDLKGQDQFVTPRSLAEAADEARRAIKKVKNEHDKEPADDLAKDTQDASLKTDKFAKLVGARAKQDRRPKVAQKLNEAVPKLDSGNKRMVDGSNDYIAEPNDKNSKEVDDSCDHLLSLIDDVMDTILPEARLTTAADLAGRDFGGLTNEQLRASFEAVRAAVVKTKKFPEHMPKETADNSSKASELVAIFAEQLRARSKEDPVRKMAEKLLQACEDLHGGNKELVRSTNQYLGEPDDDRNAQDLDAACQSLLDTLDGIWAEIDASAKRRPARAGARDNVTPSSLEEMAEKLKRAVGEVEQFRRLTPKEVAGRTEDESELASTFAEMVDEYGNQVPSLNNYLKDASKRLDKANDNIVEDANAHIQDRTNPRKQDNLDTSCANMKKLVDEIMDRIRPKINKAEIGRDPGRVTNKDLADAARELIRAADETENFDKHTPKQTADNTENTSQKAVDLADKVKKVADTVPNRDLKRVLDQAFRELGPANDELVDNANDYLDHPKDKRSQDGLNDACENLKRIANDVLREVAPQLKTPDFDNNVPSNASMSELREAYNKAKDSMKKQGEFESLAPSKTADRTTQAGNDVNRFKNLAAARARGLKGDKGSEADDLIRKLDRDNKDMFPAVQKYFDDPSNQRNRSGVKNKNAEVDQDLDDVFNAVRPQARYTAPDFNQKQREVSDAEVENAAKAAKGKVGDVKGFGGQDDEGNADNATAASARMAKFTELVYLKATSKNMPAVSGTKLREISRDLVNRNKKLVDTMNKYLDDPDDPDRANALRSATRAADNAIDKGLQAVRDASSSLKSFEDQIEAASRSIRNAANEWDADDDIVAAALRIAEEMRKLAQAAREMNRKEIILRARNIAALVKSEIIAYATPLRNNCQDATTRKEISTGTTALSSFSVQLKIIASVKAAELGVGKDKTAENQLVACCQGISTSMRQTLKSTQSAKVFAHKR